MTLRLDQLVSAITNAVVDAQSAVRQNHLSQLAKFFKDSEASTVTLRLPRGTPDGEAREVQVPLITLVHPKQLTIHEMTITTQVEVSELARLAGEAGPAQAAAADVRAYEWQRAPDALPHLAVGTTTGKKPGDVGLAQVTIRVAAEETPEGLARLLDHLNKAL